MKLRLNRSLQDVDIFQRNLILYRVAQKTKPLPNDQKIVLKPVNEIRFSHQIKVWITHNIIRWH